MNRHFQQRRRIQQHNPKKHKWCFKNLVRAGEFGVMYDFFLHGPKNSTGGKSCSAEPIALKLFKGIPKNEDIVGFLTIGF